MCTTKSGQIFSLKIKGNTFTSCITILLSLSICSTIHHDIISSANSYLPMKVKEKIDFLRFVKHSFNSNKTGGQILLSRTR